MAKNAAPHTHGSHDTASGTKPGLFGLLVPYKRTIIALVLFSFVSNSGTLAIPAIISKIIDRYTATGTFSMAAVVMLFVAALGIALFLYLQNRMQIKASETIARDLRERIIATISAQQYSFIADVTPATLLTNLTADVDAIKVFVSQAVSTLISSALLVVGTSIILLALNWRLALVVLLIIPLITVTFGLIFGKIRALFTQSREVLDALSCVISQTIGGAALVRILNAEQYEEEKFGEVNGKAKTLGLKILSLFASLIPTITFFASMATLAVVVIGGRYVIAGTMTVGEFTAFASYITILVFPLLIVGFMSSLIAQASASYGRISKVLTAPLPAPSGTRKDALVGGIEIKDISLVLDGHRILDSISLAIEPRKRTAIIGPTAAGKSQLLSIVTGLIAPTAGQVLFDGVPSGEYDQEALRNQIGFVFQESSMFNMTIRENIAFNQRVTDADLAKAVQTAALDDFIASLPEGLDTVVSERGASLSGGQKQRIMLARALALNPKILLLDDFTARVDIRTEQAIIANIARNYPGITIVSVAQTITSVMDYDMIALVMEGELVMSGTHEYLMTHCPEYVQIYQSQETVPE